MKASRKSIVPPSHAYSAQLEVFGVFLLCRKGVWWPGDRHVSEIRLAGRLRRSSGRSTAPVQPPCVPHLARAGQSGEQRVSAPLPWVEGRRARAERLRRVAAMLHGLHPSVNRGRSSPLALPGPLPSPPRRLSPEIALSPLSRPAHAYAGRLDGQHGGTPRATLSDCHPTRPAGFRRAARTRVADTAPVRAPRPVPGRRGLV